MKRGIVSSQNAFSVDKNKNYFSLSQGLNTIDINYYSLYWDKLVIPSTSFIYYAVPNEKVLIDCGFLTRPKVNLVGPLSADTLPIQESLTQTKTVDMLRSQYRNIDWSLHFLNNALFPSSQSIKKECIRMELAQLLPVPDSNVPIEDILDFKHRRSDELRALHSYCDELYDEILKSGDLDFTKMKSLERLKSCLEDLDKLNKQGWRSPIKFNMSFAPEFDLSQLGSASITGLAAIQSPHPMATLTAGAILNVLGGFIKVKPALQSMRTGKGSPHMVYISSAHKEGII